VSLPAGTVVQSDGASLYFFRPFRAFLHRKLYRKRGPIPCPPRSLELTTLSLFFLGFVKYIVYRETLQNMNGLCERIVRAASMLRTKYPPIPGETA
jgi:hypothetical protein